MSLRRFLYLAADDWVNRSYSLRRIDTSRFFFSRPSTEGAPTPLDGGGGAGATDPLALDDAVGSLPDPTLSLYAPESAELPHGLIDFMLFKSKGHDGESLKVVTVDQTGGALLCDPSLPPDVIPLPRGTPWLAPFSLTAGGSLYVMDAFPGPPNDGSGRHCSFEALSFGRRRGRLSEEWRWHSLPPPPFVHGRPDSSRCIESHAVVAGGAEILVSNRAKHTYRLDTATSEWSKAGDCPMPFSHLAEYVPEHRLWFGLSSMADGCRFLAANLMVPVTPSDSDETMSPPVVHGSWTEYVQPPPEWSLVVSKAVHLGSSRFCIARFFEVGKRRVCSETHKAFQAVEELQAVLTGVEVESRGQELRVLKHKSERYKLNFGNDHWVL